MKQKRCLSATLIDSVLVTTPWKITLERNKTEVMCLSATLIDLVLDITPWRNHNFQTAEKALFYTVYTTLTKRRWKKTSNLGNVFEKVRTVFNGYMWLRGQSGGITKTDTCVELLTGTVGSCFTRSPFNRKINRQNTIIRLCAQNAFNKISLKQQQMWCVEQLENGNFELVQNFPPGRNCSICFAEEPASEGANNPKGLEPVQT